MGPDDVGPCKKYLLLQISIIITVIRSPLHFIYGIQNPSSWVQATVTHYGLFFRLRMFYKPSARIVMWVQLHDLDVVFILAARSIQVPVNTFRTGQVQRGDHKVGIIAPLHDFRLEHPIHDYVFSLRGLSISSPKKQVTSILHDKNNIFQIMAKVISISSTSKSFKFGC